MSPEQKAIIRNNSDKILVKAGAGTGKTRVMIERILYILEQDTKLNINDFAIITFTNKATEELQSRLKKSLYRKWYMSKNHTEKERYRLQLDLLNQSNINTIHKFCHTILNTIGPFYDDHISYSPEYTIGSSDLTKLYNYTIERWIQKKRDSNERICSTEYKFFYNLKDFIVSVYKEIRNKGMNFEKIKKSTRISTYSEGPVVRSLKNEMIEILELMFKYQRNYKYNKMDTNDLLEYTAYILETYPELRNNIKNKYQHIFVDEFQDTSLFQSKIVKLLCDGDAGSPSLFVVGDIKQSIYQFRGADISAYRDMQRWIENDKEGSIMNLSTNWRSTPELVYYVNQVFRNIKKKSKYNFYHEESKASIEKSEIRMSDAYTWIKPSNKEPHEKIIAKFLSEQPSENLKDFAILTRYNYEITNIINELKKYNLTPILDESSDFYNQQEIIDIFKVLKSFLQKDNMILKEEAISSLIFRNNESLYTRVIEEINNGNLIYYYTPTQILNYIYLKTNIYANLNTQQSANLNKLKEKTREVFKNERITFTEYIHWLKLMIVSEQEEGLADVNTVKNESKVQVMTIHKAKGLEFPFVILPYLDKKFTGYSLNPEFVIHPNNLSIEFKYNKRDGKSKIISNSYEEALEFVQGDFYSEELRVLYVALTRAKQKLYLIGDYEKKTKHESFLNWLIEE